MDLASSITPDDPRQRLLLNNNCRGGFLNSTFLSDLSLLQDDRGDQLKSNRAESASSIAIKFRRHHREETKVCVVCGDHAMGYNFDALTCESCKAFFRRNALKDEDYHRCSNDNNCEVTLVTRRFCQKCRLIKCFRVGMKKEWIENEDKLLQRKRKRIEKNKRKSSCPDHAVGKTSPFHFDPSPNNNSALLRQTSTTLTIDDQRSSMNTSSRSASSSSGDEQQGLLVASKRLRLDLEKLNTDEGTMTAVESRSAEVIEETQQRPLIRQSVIQRATSASAILPIAPNTAPVLPISSPFVWPSPPTLIPTPTHCSQQVKLDDTFVSLRRSILLELIATCQYYCLRDNTELPAVVEYVRMVVTRDLEKLR